MVWGLSAFCIVHSAVAVTIAEKSSLLQVKVADDEAVEVAGWDDPTQPTCDRCAAHAAYAGFLKTGTACPGCDCGHGLRLCGCAKCENPPLSLISQVIDENPPGRLHAYIHKYIIENPPLSMVNYAMVTATWDNPKKPTCDRCAAHAALMGFMVTKHACPKCDCGNGIEVCGCAHCSNLPVALVGGVSLLDMESDGLLADDPETILRPLWDDPTKPTCDRCAAHAARAGFLETSTACPGCDCGHGFQLCGCAECENPLGFEVLGFELSLISQAVETATWDNPKRPACDRCAAHAAFMSFAETRHACPKCDCGNGIELCGCAHCDNPPLWLMSDVADDVEVEVTATWDDPAKPTCDRCGAHAAYAGFLETSSACPGCDCGHGLKLCGCASCDNLPLSLVSDVVVAATWDDPKKPACDRCAAHAALMGFMESNHACPDCDCGHGIELCGCAHCRNSPLSLMSHVVDDVAVEVTATWDDPAKPTCDRCGAHAAFSGFRETSSACPGCDCGNGLQLCGCSDCDNLPLSLVSDVVVAATWDDPTMPMCDRCAAHAAFMGFAGTSHACPKCDCGNDIELCGCAHCFNPPTAFARVELDHGAVIVGDSAADKSW